MKKTILLFILALVCVQGAAFPADLSSRKLSRYLNLACAFKDVRRYDQALKVLAAGRAAFPANRELVLLSARIRYLNGQPEQAAQLLRPMLSGRSVDPEAQLIAGLCAIDLGQDNAAQEFLRQVVENDSQNVIARLNLAQIYYRGRKLDASAEQLKAVNLIDASIQNIMFFWAQLLDEMGDFKGAFGVVEKLALAQPGNLAAQRLLEAVRRKIGEHYFQAERQKKVEQRKEKLIFVRPFPRIDKMVFVRIGLHQSQPKVQFLCSSGFDLKDPAGKTVFENLAAGHAFMIILGEDRKPVLIDEVGLAFALPGEVTIVPRQDNATVTLFDLTAGKENFWAQTSEGVYRGTVIVRVRENGFQTVNVLSMEEYLYGVVPSEMPAYWPAEALKAQAVAARSESMAKRGRHNKEGFDFCDDVHCQAYKGVEKETLASTAAVDQTRGLILSYKGKPVDAVYSSSCGGHTQGNIFGDTKDIPYLRGSADMASAAAMRFPLSSWDLERWLKEPPAGVYCQVGSGGRASTFRWVRVYSAEEMAALVGESSGVGRVEKVLALQRGPSGHISRLEIVGDKGRRTIERELTIRRQLGNLRSSLFKVEVKLGPDRQAQQFIFYGGGWGHGVGMCQTGARGMAEAGKDFRAILRHYFRNTELTQLYR